MPSAPAPGTPLDAGFFDRTPQRVAVDLLGCRLVTERGGVRTGGVIVETEAYLGSGDPGSHAATKGVTRRNRVMYGPPGTVYVYFTYGAHHMLNLVCGPQGEAGAVLIRAIEPDEGVEEMIRRRRTSVPRDLCSGPGKLTRALAVDLADNDLMLGTNCLWVYDGPRAEVDRVAASGRVGLSSGHELELRYYLKGNQHVSRERTGPRRATMNRDKEVAE